MINKHAAAKITLTVHKGLSPKAISTLKEIGLNSVLAESARCVRQNIIESWWGLGNQTKLIDSPTEIFRFRVPESHAERVVTSLIKELDLKTPGRGSIYAQTVDEISNKSISEVKVGTVSESTMKDLMLMTGIQTNSGGSKSLSKVALKLGVGVPVVGLGIGAGVRDRLGLLRITISPEKEMVYLMVPSHDSEGLQRLLIDEGELNKPGGGFLYQTPISVGIVDPLIRIGHQEHAASFEQIIAAIDDIKQGTEWRKRFFGVDTEQTSNPNKFTHKEISLTCPADSSDDYVQAAMNAGADGATTIHMRKIYLNEKDESESTINMECAIMCVKASNEEKILKMISNVASEKEEKDWFIHSVPASSVFFYKRK